MCVKLAILQIGIWVMDPSQLFSGLLKPALADPKQLSKPMGPVHAEPTGHAGGAPMAVINLTTPSLPTPASVPVKPAPADVRIGLTPLPATFVLNL